VVLSIFFAASIQNIGSALTITGPNRHEVISLVAVNTTLAAASACVSALVANYYLEERWSGEGSFSLSSTMNGCLGGLVAITGSCGVVEPWAAVITGFVAGLLYLSTSKLLVRLRIDDAVDAIPGTSCDMFHSLVLCLCVNSIVVLPQTVHMTNGIWGTLSVGLFASASRLDMAFGEINDIGIFMGGNGTLLGCQIIGILFVFGWVTTVMIPFFYLLNYLGWLRSTSADEVEGLDSRYHKIERRPSRELIQAMAVYGHGNERLRRNIHSYEQGQRQAQHDSNQFTADSEIAGGGGGNVYPRRDTGSTDTFEDQQGAITSQRRLYEQRFTADAGAS
jgi:ammonia channel protein AmtB